MGGTMSYGKQERTAPSPREPGGKALSFMDPGKTLGVGLGLDRLFLGADLVLDTRGLDAFLGECESSGAAAHEHIAAEHEQ